MTQHKQKFLRRFFQKAAAFLQLTGLSPAPGVAAIVTVKFAPWPGRLMTVTRPFMAATSRPVSHSPMPIPPPRGGIVRLHEAAENMPLLFVVHADSGIFDAQRHPLIPLDAKRSSTALPLPNLKAFDSRFSTICVKARGSRQAFTPGSICTLNGEPLRKEAFSYFVAMVLTVAEKSASTGTVAGCRH